MNVKQKQEVKVIHVETLFIGGGPATLGVFSNAYQTNCIKELVQGSSLSNSKLRGIAIVEQQETFGGGNLQKYTGIKSNTSATGFLKVIMYPKYHEDKQNPEPQPAIIAKQVSRSVVNSKSAKTSNLLHVNNG